VREHTGSGARRDLLPNVRKNFNARVKLHAAIDTIRAINQLRAGQMNGAKSKEPAHDPQLQEQAKPAPEEMEGVEGTGQLGGAAEVEVDRMEVDGGAERR